MYKYVVWDFDGTLIDSYPEALNEYKKILMSFGVEPDMNIINEYLIRYSSKETKEYMHEKYNIDISKFDEEYTRLSNSEEAINNFNFLNDAREACEKLVSMGIKNFIHTNRDEVAVKTIDKLNALDLFVDIAYIGKDGISKRKPDPEGLNYLIKKYNMDPKEILYVGDRDLDVKTSGASGVDCALYNPIDGYTTSPRYVIHEFFDLIDIINK